MEQEMKPKSGIVAFLLWLLGFVGLCGIHRFYVGRIGTGIVWLLTLGLLGVGQLIDLFFLGSMVRSANMLSGLRANAQATASANNNNVVNVTVQVPMQPASASPGAPAVAAGDSVPR